MSLCVESAETWYGEYDTDGDGDELVDGDGLGDYESEVDGDNSCFNTNFTKIVRVYTIYYYYLQTHSRTLTTFPLLFEI